MTSRGTIQSDCSKALPFAGLRESYDFARNYLSLGFVFFERGYFEQAEPYFQQALKDDPESAEALYGPWQRLLTAAKDHRCSRMFRARSATSRWLSRHIAQCVEQSWNLGRA